MKKGPRRASEPELMGAAEVAETCGTRQSNIRMLAGLPEPYGRVRATTLWRADEILAFQEARRARRAEQGRIAAERALKKRAAEQAEAA